MNPGKHAISDGQAASESVYVARNLGKRPCDGNQVEVDAFMRTRLVAPAWEFVFWRIACDTPNTGAMLDIFEKHTRIAFTYGPYGG